MATSRRTIPVPWHARDESCTIRTSQRHTRRARIEDADGLSLLRRIAARRGRVPCLPRPLRAALTPSHPERHGPLAHPRRGLSLPPSLFLCHPPHPHQKRENHAGFRRLRPYHTPVLGPRCRRPRPLPPLPFLPQLPRSGPPLRLPLHGLRRLVPRPGRPKHPRTRAHPSPDPCPGRPCPPPHPSALNRPVPYPLAPFGSHPARPATSLPPPGDHPDHRPRSGRGRQRARHLQVATLLSPHFRGSSGSAGAGG